MTPETHAALVTNLVAAVGESAHALHYHDLDDIGLKLKQAASDAIAFIQTAGARETQEGDLIEVTKPNGSKYWHRVMPPPPAEGKACAMSDHHPAPGVACTCPHCCPEKYAITSRPILNQTVVSHNWPDAWAELRARLAQAEQELARTIEHYVRVQAHVQHRETQLTAARVALTQIGDTTRDPTSLALADAALAALKGPVPVP